MPLEMKAALQSIDTLAALDEPLELYHRDAVKEKDEEEENNPHSSSSYQLNKTPQRTPSSSYDINSTPVRTGTPSSPGPSSNPVPQTEPPQGTAGTDSPPHAAFVKWIIGISAAVLLLAGGIIIAVTSGSNPATISSKWNVKADDVSETSVILSWTDAPSQNVVYSCFQGETQIREEASASSPLTISGLTPGKDYLFKLSAGNESTQLSVSTAKETTASQIPLIQRVDLFSIKVKYLENKSLAEVDGSYFDYITDKTLRLRSGPANAQFVSQTIWICFPSISNGRRIELVMSLETPDKTVFSRSTELNFLDTDKIVTYRVALDELLGDVYACYHSWPREECTLRLYFEGMSVYETPIRLESGN